MLQPKVVFVWTVLTEPLYVSTAQTVLTLAAGPLQIFYFFIIQISTLATTVEFL